MDVTDIKILNILQDNARATLKEIGSKVNLTSPAVAERIRKMEDEGVIEGYHAQINPMKLGKTISAFISVDVNPKLKDGFVEFCAKNKLIKEHYHIIGPNNVLLKAVAADSEQLNQLLTNIQVFGVSQTSIILGAHFTRKDVE